MPVDIRAASETPSRIVARVILAHPRLIVGVLLVVGALLRLSHFVHGRSLWLDEAMLALNVVGRGWMGLLAPLEYDQAAPVGFLWATRLAVRSLGSSEIALRALPFLAGLAVLPLTYAVARRVASRNVALTALAIVTFSPALIYFSSELKQYSSDALAALLITVSALSILDAPLRWRNAAGLVLLGVAAMWFSFTAVFTTGGVALALLADRVYQKRGRDVAVLGLVISLWAVALAAEYALVLRPLAGDAQLREYWSGGMLPRGGDLLSAVRWPYDAYFASFHLPAGLAFPGLAGALALVGSIGIGQRNWRKLLVLVLPLACALGAACLRAYPFADRVILFVVPTYAVLIGEGVRLLACGAGRAREAVAVVLLIPLLVDPVQTELRNGLRPLGREEVRDGLAYLAQHADSGDVLYVYRLSAPAFRFYAPHIRLPPLVVVHGASDLDRAGTLAHDIAEDVARIAGHPRVWAVFSHTAGAAVRSGLPEDSIQRAFGAYGRRLDGVRLEGARIELYDMSGPLHR